MSYVFATTYQATIFDLSTNFDTVNGGVFHVNDSVVVTTTGHNLVQLSSKSCGAILSDGLQCCNVASNNECNCPSNSFTLTFSKAGTYFFECAIPGHCLEYNLLGQITFINSPAHSSSHHNSGSSGSSESSTSSESFPTSSESFPTSSESFPTSSESFPTSSESFPTSSESFPTSSESFPTSFSSSQPSGVTYQATIFDLSTNFDTVNGGVFHVNDRIIVDTTGGHNIAQLTSKSCNAPFLKDGLQCCDVMVNNDCLCPNNTYTLQFSTVGTYFFECAVTGHCVSLGLLGQLTIINPSSSTHSGAERLSSGLNLLFVASFVLFVKFIKYFKL